MLCTSNTLFRRAATALTSGAAALILAGCGPEAPPCNDPESMQSVLTMVIQAHDAQLKGMPYASKDLATFKLDAVAPTAYDDKLKLRSCKAVFQMELVPQKVDAINMFVKVSNSGLDSLMKPLLGFGTLFGSASALPASSPFSEQSKLDVARLQMLNHGSVRGDPVRRSLAYQIQKQEGNQEFMVSTNVDVSGSLPYLRVASQGQKFMEEVAEKKAKDTAEKTAKDAEVDRLSAVGTWRRVVYIKDFGEAAAKVGDCFRRGMYCFQGWDGKNESESVYYEMDSTKLDERGRAAMSAANRDRQPVCLVGVQKTADERVFTAQGYSTFVNEKGEAVDCLPGADKQNWQALVESTKAAQQGGFPMQAQVTAPATSSAPASTSAGPSNLTSVITKYEACGDEAVCLLTGKGNTIHMQASQMRHADYAMLNEAIMKGTVLCLKDVVRTEGKHFTAESLDSRC